MATTPTAPVAPVTAPAAAAPAPAPAAVSAPPVSTPVAPVAPSAPAAAAPVTPQGPQPPAKLNPSEYGNAVDSYQAEVQWKQDLQAFREANPDVAITDESPWAGDKPAAEAAPADKPAEAAAPEEKPAEAPADGATEEQYSLAEEQTITPQMMNDILKGDEALKTAIEANPAAKGSIMKLAREHAELSQFKGIFPSAESAKFARETSHRSVGLRAQFQNADGPEGMAKAFDSFMQEFAVIGADGKQVVDESGQPVYGDDLYMIGEHVVDRYADNTLAEVEARIAQNQYASDVDRERDNDLKLALSIIKDDLHPKEGGAKPDPDLSHLDEDTRKEVQSRLDEAKRIEAENAAKANGAGKRSREQVRKEGTEKFFTEAGTRTFQQVDKIIDGLRKAGAVIPDWQLNTPLPGTKIIAFRNAVGAEIENHIEADPYEYNRQFQLELQYLANPTDANMQERVKAFDQMLQSRDESGRSLLNRIVTKLVRKYGSDIKGAAEAQQSGTAPTASKEPAQGGPVKPHPINQNDAWKMAETQLAKEVSGWDNMGQSERMTYILGRQREILTAKR